MHELFLEHQLRTCTQQNRMPPASSAKPLCACDAVASDTLVALSRNPAGATGTEDMEQDQQTKACYAMVAAATGATGRADVFASSYSTKNLGESLHPCSCLTVTACAQTFQKAAAFSFRQCNPCTVWQRKVSRSFAWTSTYEFS